jgi:diacylglycerol kinase family enzyme
LSTNAARVALVLNGNAKSVTPDLIARLERGVDHGDVFVSHSLSEAAKVAEAIVERGYGLVLSGGGDGTFTITLTEVRKAARSRGVALPRFGVLKLGTGNAMAQMVGAAPVGPDADQEALRWLWRVQSSRELYMVETEGYVTPFAGIGADAEVLADYHRTRALFKNTPLEPVAVGLPGYSLAALTQSLPKYFVRGMPQIRVINLGAPAVRLDARGEARGPEIPRGGVIYEGAARIAGVATIPFYGFNFRMFPFADLRADRMHLRISTLSSLQFARNLPAIWKGTYFDDDAIFDFHVEGVRVEVEPGTDFQIGGDTHGKRSSFEAWKCHEPVRMVSY